MRTKCSGRIPRSNNMANTPDTRTQNQPGNQPGKDAPMKGGQNTQQGGNRESSGNFGRPQQGQEQPSYEKGGQHSGSSGGNS
jgi:hypothetical protein